MVTAVMVGFETTIRNEWCESLMLEKKIPQKLFQNEKSRIEKKEEGEVLEEQVLEGSVGLEWVTAGLPAVLILNIDSPATVCRSSAML